MVVGHFKFRLALAEGAWPSGVCPFADKCSWWRVTRAVAPGTTVWRLEVPHSSVGSNHHASVNLHPRKMAKSEVSLQCGCGYSAIFRLAEIFTQLLSEASESSESPRLLYGIPFGANSLEQC